MFKKGDQVIYKTQRDYSTSKYKKGIADIPAEVKFVDPGKDKVTIKCRNGQVLRVLSKELLHANRI